MSLADEAKLLLIPSGYKSGKVYSVFPTSGNGDFTFSRSGNATRVNPGSYIETVGTNIPRIDHTGGGCPSLLLEPQRTNLALYSENFEGTNWTAGNTVVTQNDSIAPSGEQTSVKLQRTSTSASYRSHFIYKSTSAITYTTSVFVKQGEDNFFAMRSQGSYPSRVDIRFRFDTGLIYYAQAISGFTLIDYNVENYSNGWYRIYFTYTSDANATLSLTFSPRETDGNIDVSDISSNSFAYVWGVQTEVGNYLTSYIKTTSDPISRSQDFCTDGGDSDLFDITEGTFFIDVTPYNNSFDTVIGLSSGSDTQRIIIQFRNNNAQIRIFSSGGASFYANLTFDQRNKIGVTFKENEYKFFINGALVGSDTSATVPTGMDRLNFSNSVGNGSGFEGKVHDTRVYDRILTEAEAIKLTTL